MILEISIAPIKRKNRVPNVGEWFTHPGSNIPHVRIKDRDGRNAHMEGEKVGPRIYCVSLFTGVIYSSPIDAEFRILQPRNGVLDLEEIE